MDYALEYCNQFQKASQILAQLNFIHLKKKVLLPIELLGRNGRSQTSYYSNIDEDSSVKWEFIPHITESISLQQKIY